MTRTIYLMRHAQSAEKQAGQSDIDRDLTPTGMRDAMRIGNYFYKSKITPLRIITSSAARARQTSLHLLDAMKLMPEILQEDEELYEASTRTFFHQISQLDDTLDHVLFVAHNPTVSYLAEYLTKAEIGDMPPGAVAIIQLPINDWKNLSDHFGELIQYITPATLADGD